MKRLVTYLLLVVFLLTACDKSEINRPAATLRVTEAVKTGDWMASYYDNNVSIDIGQTSIKFNSANALVATQDGTNYDGTWSETNTTGNNVFTLNITTTNAMLLKANRTWKVVAVTEYIISLKDANAASSETLELMRH